MGAVTTQTEQQRLLNETYKSSVSQREAAVAIMRLETSELYLNASATDQMALRESTLTAIRIKDTAAAKDSIEITRMEAEGRSEESRVGNEGVSTGRSWWSPDH